MLHNDNKLLTLVSMTMHDSPALNHPVNTVGLVGYFRATDMSTISDGAIDKANYANSRLLRCNQASRLRSIYVIRNNYLLLLAYRAATALNNRLPCSMPIK